MNCKQCGQDKPMRARGLCGRCYTGLRREGKLNRYPIIGRRWHTNDPRRKVARAHDRIADYKLQIDMLRNEVQRLMQHERALIDELITLRTDRDVLMSELGEANQAVTVMEESPAEARYQQALEDITTCPFGEVLTNSDLRGIVSELMGIAADALMVK